jgi:hypothetical protein
VTSTSPARSKPRTPGWPPGTRAHGASRVYRYYTCFTRALATFYRDQRDLIAGAITQAQASDAAAQNGHRAELAGAEHEIANTGAAVDRYLTAFESGSRVGTTVTGGPRADPSVRDYRTGLLPRVSGGEPLLGGRGASRVLAAATACGSGSSVPRSASGLSGCDAAAH